MDAPETVKILAVRRETPTAITLVLDKKVSPLYGQFFMVWLPVVGERPYACSNCKTNMEVTVKHVGQFSEALQKLKKGEVIGIRGPYGEGHFTPKGKKPCFIAGGLGIVPLINMIEHLRKPKEATVIVGAKTKEELLFTDRIKKAGAKLLIVTDDGSAGEKAFPHQLFERLAKKEKYDSAYCCGPEIMMKAVLDAVLKEKIPAQFSLERFMKCGGLGICGSCALDPSGLLVCKDGPVFDSEALRDSEFGKYRRDAAGSKTKI